MKHVLKAIVVLGVISFSLGAIVGCGKKQDSKEVRNGGNGVSGKYYNKDDHEEYIELKADGTVFWRHVGSSGEYHEEARKWKVYGGEIALIGPLGDVERGQIEGNTIVADGEVWIRRGEPRKPTKGNIKPTKGNIPGNYILEQKFGGETIREDGITVLRKDGTINGAQHAKWKIENGFVQLYVEGRLVLTNGRLEGDDIVCDVIREDGMKVIGRFIKQDGIGRTKAQLTKAKMATIENAIGRFYMDCDRYPDDSEGLEVLLSPTPPGGVEESNWSGPYLKQSDLLDLWNRPYIYVGEGEINPGSYDLMSLGKDGMKGGYADDADIYND